MSRNSRTLGIARLIVYGIAIVTFTQLIVPCGRLWAQTAKHDRINEAIDDSVRTVLKGQVHPLARPEYDQGPVNPTMELEFVILVLRPSAEQQSGIEKLLAEQQDPASPNYHKWLTPEDYAERFGQTQNDIRKISNWLTSQGLTVVHTARSSNWLAVTGTVQEFQRSLHIEIHNLVVDGENHFANISDPSFPSSMASMVMGIIGLDDFNPRPLGVVPAISSSGPTIFANATDGKHYLAPDDLATIYDLQGLLNSGIDGTGQRIVIVGQSSFNLADITAFRSRFNLFNNVPQVILVPGNPDPGITTAQGETDLDLEWVGAIARNATIYYVYAPAVMTAVFYAIEENIAPTLSMSFGGCELKKSLNVILADEQIAQQANAQGITWIASSGDAGAAACD